jgi:hypothetical protein
VDECRCYIKSKTKSRRMGVVSCSLRRRCDVLIMNEISFDVRDGRNLRLNP